MPELTKQGVLQANIDWFLVQQKPKAVNSGGGCVYHSYADRNLRCGVGCAVPEEVAAKLAEEGDTVKAESIQNIFLDFGYYLEAQMLVFLDNIQWGHDTIPNDPNWHTEYAKFLKQTADSYDVDVVFPE